MNWQKREADGVAGIVMVCSGNTCRSPMAEALLREMLPGVEVCSAGTMTIDGLPASEGAAREMARRGLSLENHRSCALREGHLRGTQVICMEDMHLRMVRGMDPSANADTLMHLAGLSGGVPDPYGGDAAEYRAAADRIRMALELAIARGKI